MKIKIVVGELLFVFSSERDWISTAQIKFRNVGHTAASVVCVDKAGMVCTRGKHFGLAQYPVRVFAVDDPPYKLGGVTWASANLPNRGRQHEYL